MLMHALGQALAPVASTTEASFWFPAQGSTSAASIDWLFNFIMWISVFFLILVVGLLLTFVWNYRRRAGVLPERTATHHTPLELTWTIIPTILVVIIFYFGISGYVDVRTPPRNAHEVQVVGQKWYWSFTYPNGTIDSELHVPVGEPTQLTMRSEDVIHSLYIPAFRMKMDVVPGRYSKMWFTPTEVGTHHIFCAEYCGDKHSQMLSRVHVHPVDEYQRWLAEADQKNAKRDPAELGASLYRQRGCVQCHSIDGSRGIAPSFKGVYNEKQKLADGSEVVADENYLRESILEPQAKVVAGYAPVMPTFKGKLKDYELHGLIEYIKSLK